MGHGEILRSDLERAALHYVWDVIYGFREKVPTD
jgi:hypothetical protein